MISSFAAKFLGYWMTPAHHFTSIDSTGGKKRANFAQAHLTTFQFCQS